MTRRVKRRSPTLKAATAGDPLNIEAVDAMADEPSAADQVSLVDANAASAEGGGASEAAGGFDVGAE